MSPHFVCGKTEAWELSNLPMVSDSRASDHSFLPFSLLVPSSERVFTCINSFSPPGQWGYCYYAHCTDMVNWDPEKLNHMVTDGAESGSQCSCMSTLILLTWRASLGKSRNSVIQEAGLSGFPRAKENWRLKGSHHSGLQTPTALCHPPLEHLCSSARGQGDPAEEVGKAERLNMSLTEQPRKEWHCTGLRFNKRRTKLTFYWLAVGVVKDRLLHQG